MKGVKLESKKSLDFIVFKLQGTVFTTYNQHFIKEKEKTSFFTYMLMLWEFLNPSTSKDLLWTKWNAASPNKDRCHIGIRLSPTGLKSFRLNLSPTIETNLIRSQRQKILERSTGLHGNHHGCLKYLILGCENDLGTMAESYEAVLKHRRISTTPKLACRPKMQLAPKLSRNHCSDRKTDHKKTSSNP